ncbi:50S ribosomal protein L6 [Candidatus Pacearchaeota archaeon]|nr:MAG: 50S ribosomal protein L6 [Candidatus Pacearchaeota archaeon]
MKKKIEEVVELGEGVEASYSEGMLKLRKGDVELERKLFSPEIKIEVSDGKIRIFCERGNKNQLKKIKTFRGHVENMLKGLDKEFEYVLEICSVHFPMNVSVEGQELVIKNFLGEKIPRRARILPGVKVEVKGNNVVVSSHSIEAAGQTAANIELATRVRKRDRRIFQDGIYITAKPE